LRNDEEELRRALEFDDKETETVRDHRDDEYAWAGVEDPKLMITTSHNPSSRLKQFVKELKLVFPNSQRMNRGNYVIGDLVNACRANNVTDLIVIHEHRGEPDALIVCHLPYGPTASFSLSNTIMRHDIETKQTMSQVFPHLIFHNMDTRLGERVKSILKYLFPVPKEDSKRVITFANQEDYISFRHHMYKKTRPKDIELTEVGPRFEMKLYEIRLGTMEQTDADVEWRLKPYMNTARKRMALSSTGLLDQ
jgi:U3 small nucleolar ribonucleoprotein protein IMP4